MEDFFFVLMVALPFAVPSFLILAGVASVVYRLASGKFFRLISVPMAIAFVVYLAIWVVLSWGALGSIAVTH